MRRRSCTGTGMITSSSRWVRRRFRTKLKASRRLPPPKWDEERGMHVLEGGTQDIMFVKDGVRVSEVDLQPGGVLPKHHHAGPHLVVAVSDLDMRSDVEGMGPMP